jgi:hypothetical protein
MGSRSGLVRENAPTTWVPMATATMAWEERKAAACGCIGRAEAPRRPPEWRRSRCCTVVHSIGAPDLACSGIRGLFGCHPEPDLPDRSPSLSPAPASGRLTAGLQQLNPAAKQPSRVQISVLEEQADSESMGSGDGKQNAPTGNGAEIYRFLFEPSDHVPVAWIMYYLPRYSTHLAKALI